MSHLKKVLLGTTGAVAICLIMLLIGEGANAILSWKQFDGSFTYKTYRIIKTALRDSPSLDSGPAYTRLLSREHLERLIPKLMALDAGLGNSPYLELQTPASVVNQRDGDCLVQKPNLRRTMTYLRTNLFNPLDPPALFYDSDRTPDEEIEALMRDYGTRSVSFTSNRLGERTTLPHVASERVVLVAGDSVANGTLIDDAETLSSQMQARLQQRVRQAGFRYLDIGCVALQEIARRETQFAVLSLFNDHVHLSPYGIDQVAEALNDN
ncbi:MAG: hypothetical protein O7B81_14050 [Gammaproteobacteria bacterium]|nr:hypothetical protein [Gammaproteobacteria bacterium]